MGRVTPAPWHVRGLRFLVAFFMFAIMAVMFTDVIGRYVFDASIQGGFEIIAYLLGMLIFSGFPLVTRAEDHITVGLLDSFIGGRVAWFRDLAVLLASAGAVLFIALRMWEQGDILAEEGQVGQMFDVPIAPIVYVFAVFAFVTFALLVQVVWTFIRRGYAGRTEA